MFEMEFPTGIGGRYYLVEKKKNRHYQIYFCHYDKKFITHRTNSKQATKLAKLLAETYHTAYCEGAY